MATYFEKKRHYAYMCIEESMSSLRTAMTALAEFSEAREAPENNSLFSFGPNYSMVKKAADILEDLEVLRQKTADLKGIDKGLLPANAMGREDEKED